MAKQNLRQILAEATERLSSAGVQDSGIDAFLLVEYVFGISKASYYADPIRDLADDKLKEFWNLVDKRASHFPLQYITGEQYFMGLPFKVSPDVLIPRQDTEILVETVLSYMKSGMHVLDMCTGSGCIIISLKHYFKECVAEGCDISLGALEVAKSNALLNKVDIDFSNSDLFNNIKGHFDIIVSNPPYIKSDVVDTLMPEVKDFEPRLALDGEADGLKFYREICRESVNYLNPKGMLFFEIGFDQGEEVKELLIANGFTDVTVKKDLAGLDRVVYGRKN